jgi:hypothetical protein
MHRYAHAVDLEGGAPPRVRIGSRWTHAQAHAVAEVKRELGWDVRERRERRLGTVLAVLGLGGGTGVCFWALALVCV